MSKFETKVPRQNFTFYTEDGTEVCGKFVIPQTAKKFAKRHGYSVKPAAEKLAKKDALLADLQKHIRQCIGGSSHLYSLEPISKIKMTEGVKGLAEIAGAFWLITDIVAVAPDVPFQVWTLNVTKHQTATLQCREDTNTPVLYGQVYTYTDFPEGDWEFYIMDGVMLLPEEY